MKDAQYFSHDSNASRDPKIIAMRGVYGSAGYGWYWMLVEMMRESDGYKLEMQAKYAFNAYAMHLQCEGNAIASFVHDCIEEFKLFSSDGEHFWSESLLRRMEKMEEKSEKARQSASVRWKKQPKDANASESNANALKNDALKESKRKEIKVKESKVKAVIKDSPQFVEFWNMYPRKVGNTDALSAWNNAIKRGAIASDIFKAVENYKINIQTAGTETQFIKHPASFLNKDRWKEYLTQLTVVHGGKQSTTSKLQDLFNRAKEEEEKLEANGGY